MPNDNDYIDVKTSNARLHISKEWLPGCCAFDVFFYPSFYLTEASSLYGETRLEENWKKHKPEVEALVKKLASIAIDRPIILADSINQPGRKYSVGPFVKDMVDIIKELKLGEIIATRPINNPKGEHKGSICKIWLWLTPKVLIFNQKNNKYWNTHETKEFSRGSESGRNVGDGGKGGRSGLIRKSRRVGTSRTLR